MSNRNPCVSEGAIADVTSTHSPIDRTFNGFRSFAQRPIHYGSDG